MNLVDFQSSVILVHRCIFRSLGGVLGNVQADLSLVNNVKTIGQRVSEILRSIFSACLSFFFFLNKYVIMYKKWCRIDVIDI